MKLAKMGWSSWLSPAIFATTGEWVPVKSPEFSPVIGKAKA